MEALAERVFESIAEDERLRGGLTDYGYGPLLDWCASRLLVVCTTPDVDEDRVFEAFHCTMAALVAAAATGDPAYLEQVCLPAVDLEQASALHHALERGGDDPDARAVSLAAALHEVSP